MRIVELTERTWPALETLFSANKTVGGCWCTYFMRPHAEGQAGWGAENREFLRSRLGVPLGLLALDEEGEPAGWVAVASRSTYPRLATSKTTRSDGDGPDTWSVTCFFVHRRARRRGLAAALLAAGDIYHGTLEMFLAADFELVERRGTRRALVRKEIR